MGDATAEAKAIVAEDTSISSSSASVLDNPAGYFSATFASTRGVQPSSLRLPDGDQIKVKDLGKIQIGRESQDANGDNNYLDLTGLQQLTETGQTKLIGEALQTISTLPEKDENLDQLLTSLYVDASSNGLDIFVSGRHRSMGDLSFVRKFELAAAINRWRSLRVRSASNATASVPLGRQVSDGSTFSMDSSSSAFYGDGAFDEYDDHPMSNQGFR